MYIQDENDDSQMSLNFSPSSLPELSWEEIGRIRKQISLRWKGMANRANYQDMNEAIGLALRKSPMSVDDKREFAINIARNLHFNERPVVYEMTVDHICRLAGVGFERIESALQLSSRYPYR